jgi:uncharacterized protein YprB with RNaseH-like and TPR domain
MRDLASRLREIVHRDRPASGATPSLLRDLVYVPEPEPTPPFDEAAACLGGEAVETGDGCLAIDRVYAADRSHGRKRVESCLPDAGAPIHLFDKRLAGQPDWHRRIVFFDIETTGLSGGAGTLPFLVGCGWFEPGGFRVRQFFLTTPAGESAMLAALARVFADASLLVTYNGRTFDVPLMESRWAFHRRAAPTDDLPHFDMLPPARRLWRRREAASDDAGCSLSALERSVLGFYRLGDVPGFEIPTRYFQFLRTGNSAVIDGVLEHNRWDLVSLAAIMAHALWLAEEGPVACREPSEQLALGRLYLQNGDAAAARGAFEMAASGLERHVRREATAELAVLFRRDGQYTAAAAAWQQVLDWGDGRPARTGLDRRAAEALAIHHEHRAKDPAAARQYAALLKQQAGASAADRKVQHRIARLDRKLGTGRNDESDWWPAD